jgi:NifU-like protein involved in Fe-S cluster formation
MPPFNVKEGPEISSPATAAQFWLGPFNEGIIQQANGWAVVTGPCGDTMEIFLRIEKNRVKDSRFRVNGCAVSRACASSAAAEVWGKEKDHPNHVVLPKK